MIFVRRDLQKKRVRTTKIDEFCNRDLSSLSVWIRWCQRKLRLSTYLFLHFRLFLIVETILLIGYLTMAG